jgi:chaperonin cofactor prefoldin
MSELEEYLKARFSRPSLPESATPIKIEEKKEVGANYSRRRGIEENHSDEEDFDTCLSGSDFWKTVYQKKVQPIDSFKDFQKGSPRDSMVLPRSDSVATLLKKMKDEKDNVEWKAAVINQETPGDALGDTHNQIDEFLSNAIATIQNHMDKLEQQIQAKLSMLFANNSKSESSHGNPESKENFKLISSIDKRLIVMERSIETILIKFDALSNLIQSNQQVTKNAVSFDRPTSNLLVGINDKIIHYSKSQEHFLSNITNKISSLDRTLNHIKNTQMSDCTSQPIINQRLSSKSNHTIPEESDEGSARIEMITQELQKLQTIVKEDGKITQDRMAQFLNMFTIIEQSHSKLYNLKDSVDSAKALQGSICRLEIEIDTLKRQNNQLVQTCDGMREYLTRLFPEKSA